MLTGNREVIMNIKAIFTMMLMGGSCMSFCLSCQK